MVKLKMTNDIAIKVENLSKLYKLYNTPIDRLKEALHIVKKKYHKDFYALSGVSFEIKRGDTVGIIGRNGSGKSTLLKIIAGVLSATTGTVAVNGRVSALLELGAGFNVEYTGIENIYFNATILGYLRKDIDAKLDEIIAFADIGTHINQPVRTYSSGMMVRLAFAIQSITDPEILIVDEALAVGDALFQKKCFQQLEKLRNNGVTLLFVSHDQETIRSLTNHAILLQRGQILSIGNSSEVLLAYRKLLHEEETSWFAHIAEIATQNPLKNKYNNCDITTSSVTNLSSGDAHRYDLNELTDTRSFGNLLAAIDHTIILNSKDEPTALFGSKEKIKIRIDFTPKIELEHINVGIRIRNKQGLKMYSWGTLNQDITRNKSGWSDDLFWDKKFLKDIPQSIIIEFVCLLGVDLYEVQSYITYERKFNYTEQRILHWVDDAAFFQVTLQQNKYHFGGCMDLMAVAYELKS